jgi:hypothetical protein
MPSLLAILGLDATRFEAGLKNADRLAQSAGKNIGSALSGGIQGALTSLAGGLAIRHVFNEAIEEANKAKEILHGSERIGVGTERFQQLERAAEKSGTSIDAVFTAYKKLAVASVEAGNGNIEVIAAMKTLGVSTREPNEMFKQLSQNLKNNEIDASRLAAAIKLLGKGADELIPAFKKGAFDVANPFGRSEDELKANAEFGKNVSVIKEFFGWLERKALSPAANKEGLISRFLGLEADSIRTLFNIRKQAEASGGAVPLTTVAAADLEGEKKKHEQEKKHAEEIKKLKLELFKKQEDNDFEQLSTAEKIAALERRRAAGKSILASSKDEEDRLKAALGIEDIDRELSRAKDQMVKDTMKKPATVKPDLNALQQIGAYSSSPMENVKLDLDRKSEGHLSEIKEGIKTLVNRGTTGGTQF